MKKFVLLTLTAITTFALSFADTTYIVEKGDTLYSIAKKFNTTVDSIKKKNNLVDNTLIVGQVLNI